MCCCVLCILYYTEKVEIHSDFLNLNLAPPQDRKEKSNYCHCLLASFTRFIPKIGQAQASLHAPVFISQLLHPKAESTC